MTKIVTTLVTGQQYTQAYAAEVKASVNVLYDQLGNYKSYIALLTANAGTVTAKVLNNTLSGVISWSNPGNGQYRGTLSGAFTTDKTFIINGGLNSYFVNGKPGTVNFVNLNFTYFDNTTSNTPNFTDLPIEIRVYE